MAEFGKSDLNQFNNNTKTGSHTNFAESAPVLVRTGTAEPGPPLVLGAGASILAGVWPARSNHCEHREKGEKAPEMEREPTSDMMRRCGWNRGGKNSPLVAIGNIPRDLKK